MSRSSERFFSSQNWHVDCRLVAELPEDSVVGVRFIIYLVSIAIALAALLFTGWFAYSDANLRQQIADANHRLEDDYWDVAEIRRLQRFYEIEAKKIESAYSEIKDPILFSRFISYLGQTMPERMIVDAIEYADGKLTIRGRFPENPEKASELIGAYVAKLRKDPDEGPRFSAINITALERSTEDEQMMTYELTFHLKPQSP
jgi:hypothetical protein